MDDLGLSSRIGAVAAYLAAARLGDGAAFSHPRDREQGARRTHQPARKSGMGANPNQRRNGSREVAATVRLSRDDLEVETVKRRALMLVLVVLATLAAHAAAIAVIRYVPH